MTAEVLTDFFTHEHNRLEVAKQEHDLACEDYASASAKFNALDGATRERFFFSLRRRNRAWDVLNARQRGSSAR